VKGQSGERYDRRAIKRGIVETVHQMDRARTCRANANAKAASMFGPSGRHEGGGFLMPYADIPYPILAFSQRFYDRIDAVADDAKYVGRAPSRSASQRLYPMYWCRRRVEALAAA
jgi:hypothetical protein